MLPMLISPWATALLNWGWVPQTFRGIHYWQLPWLANPGNPAMSPHPEGKGRGPLMISQTMETRDGGGRGTTQRLCWNAEWCYNKYEGSTDNRRPLTVQAYQCKLKACTGASARTNAGKCNGTQTLDGCTHKTLLGMKEHWQRWMHWHVYITIAQTLFVVNKINVLCC